jgi:peptidyl-tRNA hydrolase, PTH1 family
MKLLVGLGNPGEKYARNRHNVGFMAVQAIASAHGLPAWRRRFAGMVSEGQIGGVRCLLLLPTTYMNDSGRSVGEAAHFLKIAENDVIVVHDEIDLAPGKLKVKAGGGVAGHNGLRSITAHVGNDYVRVRIGIGHPGSKEAVPHYVLHDFAKVEHVWLDPMIAAMAKAAPYLVKGQADRFMNEVGRVNRSDDSASAAPQSGEPSARRVEPGPPKQVERSALGDSGTKRAGALAENIRRWLAGRKKGADQS